MIDAPEIPLHVVSDAVDNPAPAEPQAADGVAVLVTYADDGNVTIDVQVMGTTRVTEADTLLAKGRTVIRERLGIN